ncbi:MAG: flagellar hook-associated protein FlgK [Kiloniellales bacterium]|nr:flagellar hook-associated protein FlgK [Kiloniellales bacterium]
MSLSLTLNAALSGIQTQQASLQIVSDNIANATTEGYTRKTAESKALILAGLGSGVELGTIQRKVDETLMRDIRAARSTAAVDQVAQPFYQQMQDLFGSPGADSSISASITDLASAMAAYSASPEGPTQRIEVIKAAQEVVRQLQTMSEQVQTLRSDAERQLSATVDEVNSKLQEIADLNDEIVSQKARGETTAGLEDKRDTALGELSQYLDIQTFTRSSGEVVVFTTEGTLLDSFPNFLSHSPLNVLAPANSYANGDIDGISLNNRDITTTLRGGELKGLINLRDSVLPGLQAEIDQLAGALRDEINALHNKGIASPPPQTLSGTRLFDSANDVIAVSGTLRFAAVDSSGKVPDNIATAQPFSVNLSGITAPVTLTDLVNEINTQAAASPPQVIQAQLVTVGSQVRLEISTLSPSLRVVMDEGDSAVSGFTPNGGTATTVQLQNGSTPGLSHFFGLNDFFTSPSFNTGESTLTGMTRALSVRQDIVSDPSLIARSTTAMTFPLTGGQSLVSPGDNSTAQAMAAKFDEKLSFSAAGNLPAVAVTFAGYGAEIIFENSTAAARSESNVQIQEALHQELKFRSDSLSGVNVDEELANMIVIQQAYSSSARLVTTVQEMFQVLQQMVS